MNTDKEGERVWPFCLLSVFVCVDLWLIFLSASPLRLSVSAVHFLLPSLAGNAVIEI
jgi:hypothetical protein